MKILHVLDSLEINGGTSMCFEMFRHMRENLGLDAGILDVEILVVSKTGGYGRKGIVARDIYRRASIFSVSYERFFETSAIYRDHVVIHHRLQCTRPLKFQVKPRLYLIVNHTVQDVHRIEKFVEADLVVSVCEHLRSISPKMKVPHEVVLNGIGRNKTEPLYSGGFITGRCHRLPSGKFSVNSLRFLDELNISGHIHYLAGPENAQITRYIKKNPQTCVRYLGKIDDYEKKCRTMRSFDLYFYDTYQQEAASMAILEGLAAGVPVMCKALGGNSELVKNGINGFLYRDFADAAGIIRGLAGDRERIKKAKEKVVQDFDKRLNISICVSKYLELIEKHARD